MFARFINNETQSLYRSKNVMFTWCVPGTGCGTAPVPALPPGGGPVLTGTGTELNPAVIANVTYS